MANVMIIDADGLIVSADDQKLTGRDGLSVFGIDVLPEQTSVIEKEDQIIFTSGQDDRGWTYIGTVSDELIKTTKNEMQFNTYIIVAVVLLFTVLVLIYITTNIVSPVNRLSTSIEAVESADMAELTFKPKYNDEIGRLAKSYNHMIIKLKNSVEKIKSIEKIKQRAEMKMLEAQINPHFLYNTLSSIIWLVHKDMKTEAIEMLEALACLYKISVSGGREYITVNEEFLHAESYLRIQEKRYKGDFTFDIEKDPDLDDYLIIKVILQPLVENAIYHGVKKRDGGGIIRVRGELADSRLRLIVMDNGCMMTSESCEEMNAALEGRAEGVLGIGVSNVYNRLRLFYGDKGSMRYDIKDGFTTVTIELPARKEGEDV